MSAPHPQDHQDHQDPPVPVVSRWRFAAGSLLAVVVTGAVAYALCLVLESLFGVELAPPPGFAPDLTHAQSFGITGAGIGLGAAVAMALLAASVSRPRLFFGWSMVLVVAALSIVPFTWTDGVVNQAFTAALFLVTTVTAWAVVSGVAIRTVRVPVARRPGRGPEPSRA